MKKLSKKRQVLGTGFVWFSTPVSTPGHSYVYVHLTKSEHGHGEDVQLKIGELGGWQKVRLVAEYVKKKAPKR